MKMSMMITTLKMKKMKKALKKRHNKISTHQTGIMIQVTTSSKIKSKKNKKTPPLKMTVQKKIVED